MGKKLAIKGHETRGKEIIELLEMMGGINKNMLSAHIGDVLNPHVYFLEPDFSDNRIVWNYLLGLEWDGRASDMMIFTLEEFLEKYPYKLNDLALCDDGLLGIITKMEWDCEKSDMKYYISFKISDYNKWYSSKNIKCTFMEVKGKKLAIKGHETRGKEVIELLEMMGGVNSDEAYGNLPNKWNVSYYIFKDGVISLSEDKILTKKQFEIFTLEEFLEKYPFKVGDFVRIPEYESEVRICKMKWCEFGYVEYLVYRNDDEEWYTAEELLDYNDNPNETLKNKEEKKINQMSLANCDLDEVEIVLGDKFELKIEDGKYYAVRKKSKYPTTYDECCEVLVGRKPKPNEISFDKMELCLVDLDNTQSIDFQNPYLPQLNSLFRLRMCRDAYWEIYGEETGLGKPWEPAIQDTIWGITRSKGEVEKYNCHYGKTNLLEFPTEEIRDIFYKNFKNLIEECKELL